MEQLENHASKIVAISNEMVYDIINNGQSWSFEDLLTAQHVMSLSSIAIQCAAITTGELAKQKKTQKTNEKPIIPEMKGGVIEYWLDLAYRACIRTHGDLFGNRFYHEHKQKLHNFISYELSKSKTLNHMYSLVCAYCELHGICGKKDGEFVFMTESEKRKASLLYHGDE